MHKGPQEESTPAIDLIIECIYALASGNLSYRLQRVDEDSNENNLDAIVEGLNMLAEELESTTVSRDTYQEALEELKETHVQLIQTAKLASLGEMAANIAHEINQPLQVISMAAQMLSLNDGDENEESEYLEKIQDQVRRASKIIAHMRVVGRDTTRLPHARELLSDIIKDSLILGRERLRLSNIEIKLNLNEDLFVYCNKIQIEQVFMNLLSNSMNAIGQNGIVTIESFVSESNAVITFTDTGGGIREDKLQRIFEPFFTTKEVGKGTGLGLSISRSLIEEHNGEITVSSEVGKETTFTITLPLFNSECDDTHS